MYIYIFRRHEAIQDGSEVPSYQADIQDAIFICLCSETSDENHTE